MILYHFTALETLLGDLDQLPEGGDNHPIVITELAPSSRDYPEMPPVVWLTVDPHPGGDPGQCCFARIKLIIPSTDRRLCSCKAFTKKMLRILNPEATGADIEDAFCNWPYPRALTDWWTYEGAIPQNRWAKIDVVKGRQVWWGSLGGYQIGREIALADVSEATP